MGLAQGADFLINLYWFFCIMYPRWCGLRVAKTGHVVSRNNYLFKDVSLPLAILASPSKHRKSNLAPSGQSKVKTYSRKI